MHNSCSFLEYSRLVTHGRLERWWSYFQCCFPLIFPVFRWCSPGHSPWAAVGCCLQGGPCHSESLGSVDSYGFLQYFMQDLSRHGEVSCTWKIWGNRWEPWWSWWTGPGMSLAKRAVLHGAKHGDSVLIPSLESSSLWLLYQYYYIVIIIIKISISIISISISIIIIITIIIIIVIVIVMPLPLHLISYYFLFLNLQEHPCLMTPEGKLLNCPWYPMIIPVKPIWVWVKIRYPKIMDG